MEVTSNNESQKAVAFWEIFLQRGAAGGYIFNDDDVRGFLPMLYIQLYQVLGDSTPKPIQQQLQQFVDGLGLPADADSTVLESAIEAHFEKHPPNPHLLKAYERFVRENFKGELSGDVGRSFAKFADARAVAFAKSPDTSNKKAGGALSALLGVKSFDSKKKQGQ